MNLNIEALSHAKSAQQKNKTLLHLNQNLMDKIYQILEIES